MIRRLVDVKEREVPGLWWSFAYFFALLCAYSMLKPLRDEMGIAGGVRKLQWTFTATFLATLIAVPLFSALVAHVPRRRLLPWVYRALWLMLLAFFVLMRLRVAPTMVARTFFVWTSVINLFLVSVFWAFMADTFRSSQGKRLFGFIAAGGTIGTLVGPLLSSMLVRFIGTTAVLIGAALLLELAAQCIRPLVRWADAHAATAEETARLEGPVGGGALAGFRSVVRSPFLLAVCGQTLLYAITSTVLYAHYLSLISEQVTDSAKRTELFGYVETAVNALTLGLQALVTGRLMQRLGLAVTLAVVPALTVVGFASLGLMALLSVVVVFFVLRRGLHYAFERPSREVLFTTVDRETKYKAKPLIDTVVYRGGDAVGGWINTGFGAAGLGLAGSSWATLPFAAAWMAVNVYLARRQEAAARAEETQA